MYKTHIDVVHFRKTDSSRLQDSDDKREFEPERVQELEELAKKPDIYERLARALAPSIYENEDVKKGFLLQVHESDLLIFLMVFVFFSCLVVIGRT